MTAAERLRLTLEMTRDNARNMFRGAPRQIDRRFEILRVQNERRNRNMLEAIARTSYGHG